MEINTVPRFDARDARGTLYTKLPALHFPVDEQGQSYLVQDVTYYGMRSRMCSDSGVMADRHARDDSTRARIQAQAQWHTTRYDQAGKRISGIERVFDTKIFEGNVWGLQWRESEISPCGLFPRYYKAVGDERLAVAESRLPEETKLQAQEFKLARPGKPYTSPKKGALGHARAETRTASGQACRRLERNLPVVSLRRSAVIPAVRVERCEESQAASACREDPRRLADRSRLHGGPPSRGKLVSARSRSIVTPPSGLEVGSCLSSLNNRASESPQTVRVHHGKSL